MHIVVASNNPVKMRAALTGFQRMFPAATFTIQGEVLPSGVSAQPMTDAETLAGALGRVENARLAFPNADYWVGIEGGIEDEGAEMSAFAWVVICGSDGRTGKGRSGSFYLPPSLAELIRSGVELGEADDRVFGRSNSKQGNGAIGLLTDDVIDRAELYIPAVIFALIPFKKPELFPGEG